MKTAKIFRNGQSQAVRLPKEFRFKGSKVSIKRLGNSLVLTPIEEDPWEALYNSLHQFSADFMADREQPDEQQKREEIF
jgi:antitoxin VapB